MSEAGKSELGALWEIVKKLADGQFHSGEELGKLLGVSRAAVWKHLQKLEYYGIALSSIKGRGYCIQGGLDLLDREQIRAHLKSRQPLVLHVLPQLDSTNSFLMRQENPALQVCFSEFQSAGRGRRGRSWVSPMGQNIYCSIGWGFEGGVAAIEGLSLAIGVAIVRAVNKIGLIGAVLKWPNDVLYQGKKLAGILIEMTGDPAGYCQVVIGVGLNISMQASETAAIDQPWVALNQILTEQAQPLVSRNQLAAILLDELVIMLQTYHEMGFAGYQMEWMAAAAYKNVEVQLHNGQLLMSGVFLGVTETGALRLLMEGREHIFHGGEISLRVLQ